MRLFSSILMFGLLTAVVGTAHAADNDGGLTLSAAQAYNVGDLPGKEVEVRLSSRTGTQGGLSMVWHEAGFDILTHAQADALPAVRRADQDQHAADGSSGPPPDLVVSWWSGNSHIEIRMWQGADSIKSFGKRVKETVDMMKDLFPETPPPIPPTSTQGGGGGGGSGGGGTTGD